MQTQFSLDLDFATSLLSEGLAQANQQEALLNLEEQNFDINILNMLLTHCIQLPGFIQIFGSILTQDFFKTFFQNNNFFFKTLIILGDPGADKGDEGKSKRAEKYIWNEEK